MITWVLPSVDPAYRDECLATLHPAIHDRTLVLDNSIRNRGVAASWNLGAQRAINNRSEWLVLLSESVRFGETGGCDLEAELRADQAESWIDTTLGWHLVAFRARTLRRVGRFDENFPAYLEDTDYLIRLHLAGYPSPRENDRPHRWLTGLDCWNVETEHSIRAGLVVPDLGACRDYYRSKWLSEPPGAATEHPFGNPERDWAWWPEPAPVAR